MVNINAVIAVVGATVILVATMGLTEIRSRAGPFEEPLVPASIPLTTTGSYLATGPRGTQGPGNVCVPPTGETQCSAPRLTVDLAITGLPALTGSARYQAFLIGDDTLSLGSLTSSAARHTMRHDEARDARGYRQLLITLQDEETTTPSGIALFSLDVAGKGQAAPAQLTGAPMATIGSGTGTVRAAEIGAFAKSTTAIAELNGISEFEGWTYHAWFVTLEGAYISLGAWEVDETDPSHAILDGRVEKMRLEDQRLFLTTLEPADVASRDSPGGPPVFVVDFTQASKAMP